MHSVEQAAERETIWTVLWAVSGFALGLHLALALALVQWLLDGGLITVAPLI